MTTSTASRPAPARPVDRPAPARTGDGVFRWAAAALYLALVAAWALVSVRTVAGTWRGSLLRGAPPVLPPDGPGVRADEVAALTRTGEGITSPPA